MPMIDDEEDLQIEFPEEVSTRKFDGDGSHGLSHCMKAVDHIVELNDRILFIEFKDPEHPESQKKDRERFIKKFLSGQIDGALKTKYRDSFLYEWASGRADKPIYYFVLIAAQTLSEAELLARTDALNRLIPINGPNDNPWRKPFVAGCAVMNLATWNKALPRFPASRISP